jgi:hypothetical protein
MGKDNFSMRRNELEEKFFREKDMELIRAMREKTATMERKRALAEASGIEHDDLLDQLVQLEMCTETLAALSLVPLVAVAWADGQLHDKERDAVLTSAEQVGLEKGHAGHDMLVGWLGRKPDKKLISTWYDYVNALNASLSPEAKAELKEDLLDRARKVAEATGGLLGLGRRISKEEQGVLDELARAFD